MNLTKTNITFYIRYYKLIALAVLIMVAVIVGSLVVGDSVRSTLVQRVHERLGNTETILFSKNSFLESSVVDDPLFEGQGHGVLLSNGFISNVGQLIPVMVWGVDDKDIPKGGAKINQTLAEELKFKVQGSKFEVGESEIVLRLPATGLAPSGSLFVTDNYTSSARLALAGVVDAANGGNLNLKNEQIVPYNIFVNRTELASILEIENKINLILCEKPVSYADFSKIWTPALSGLNENRYAGFTEITSDRVFIQGDVVQTLCSNHPNANRLFSYLVNSIGKDGALPVSTIPYSFVTAADQYKGRALRNDEFIFSDYAANRIGAKLDDSICITYYVSKDLKTLSVDTLYGRVGQIVPLSELAVDKTLSADFPGLSDVEKCTDWDSDLPIDMSLITKEDEDYWTQYRTTPKILIPYSAVYEKWGNAYGNATAIRFPSASPVIASPELEPAMFGIQLIQPKEMGLNAARNGVDFSSLFLSLGFFIILSAILLMLVPLSEMLYVRRNEIALFSALGYSKKRIVGILWRESAPVVVIASLLGIVAGLLYTWLILTLLGSLWKGATHTGGFTLFPSLSVVLAGFVAGLAISLVLLWRSLSSKFKKPLQPPRRGGFKVPLRGIRGLSTLATLFCIFLAATNTASLFVVSGFLLIVTAACWGDYIIQIKGKPSPLIPRRGTFRASPAGRLEGLSWSNLYANRKRTLLSFFTLTAGVFIVFSVGLNRRGFADSSQLTSGTGGYSLWCESSVPVYHNMATEAGREKLALSDLPEDTRVIQMTRYSADDASCLNLNKVSQPTVLGVDMNLLKTADFEIEKHIYSGEKPVFDALQTGTDSVYPVLIDETVLMWGLMMNLGDTISYESGAGKRVYLQLAGMLKNSVFQGNVLMDKQLFSEIWGEITGSEIALVKINETETEETKKLLSQALNEYGVKVTTTAQRLKEFNSVTDAYLNIFLTLGGLGLLLGIMGFIIVIRKDLSSRTEQIALYRSLGFTDDRISKILVSENRLVPLSAVVVGVVSSLLGVSGGFANVGLWVWLSSFVLSLFLIVCIVVFIHKSVRLCLSKN
ncbi:FtsX-like permease family protein [Viscerimonas tarda]